MSQRPLRILSVAHSYAVELNRRLAHEMARAGGDRWAITAVAPRYFHGGRDLRPVRFDSNGNDACALELVDARLTRSVHAFFYGRRMRRLLAGPIDLVHQWEEPYVLAGAQVAFWTPRDVPLVFWTAQNLPKHYPPPFAQFEEYCVSRCAGWMACGQQVVGALTTRDGYARKPHRVMPLGVDVEHFRPDAEARRQCRRELGFDETNGPPVIGFTGRFVAEKGPAFLSKVLDGLKVPWRALFIGNGPLRAPLQRWVDRHGSRARLRSDVVHADVWRFLNAIDILCVPSCATPRWREQFGRVIVEAFACGVPVVAGDSGEIPHVTCDAGIICPERDRSAWIAALRDLIESPQRRRELARRGLDRARERFAWPVVARAHLEFFDQVLQAGAPR
jgi:glycosyltransferase involved in cell wall biosynthesis